MLLLLLVLVLVLDTRCDPLSGPVLPYASLEPAGVKSVALIGDFADGKNGGSPDCGPQEGRGTILGRRGTGR